MPEQKTLNQTLAQEVKIPKELHDLILDTEIFATEIAVQNIQNVLEKLRQQNK